MIKTIFAIIGIITVVGISIKSLARIILQSEHENDKTRYQIIKDGNIIWESDFVKEFSLEEHAAFQNFCKEWAKYPGSTAKWERISE